VQQAHPLVARTITLAQAFARTVRQQSHAHFDAWMEQARASGAVRNFALGLRQDEAAVRAALHLPWTTDQWKARSPDLNCANGSRMDGITLICSKVACWQVEAAGSEGSSECPQSQFYPGANTKRRWAVCDLLLILLSPASVGAG